LGWSDPALCRTVRHVDGGVAAAHIAPQSLMRHANSNITMNIYTHAVSSKKRPTQMKVVEMILPERKKSKVTRGAA